MSCERLHRLRWRAGGAGRGGTSRIRPTRRSPGGTQGSSVCTQPTWEFGEICLPVLAAILVVPEVRGLAGERLGAHQLSTLSPNCLSWFGRKEEPPETHHGHAPQHTCVLSLLAYCPLCRISNIRRQLIRTPCHLPRVTDSVLLLPSAFPAQRTPQISPLNVLLIPCVHTCTTSTCIPEQHALSRCMFLNFA